jgi:SpoVK/Ycf46/Vps4 family AAA+-type ATPase
MDNDAHGAAPEHKPLLPPASSAPPETGNIGVCLAPHAERTARETCKRRLSVRESRAQTALRFGSVTRRRAPSARVRWPSCTRIPRSAARRRDRHTTGVARADLLIRLVRAARAGDEVALRRTAEALIAEEREKQHHLLADRLEEALRPNGTGVQAPALAHEGLRGVAFVTARRKLDDLILGSDVRQALDELVEEQSRIEVLRAHALEPRHRLLLTGPPGNGKTSVAEGVAEALMLPLLVVRYEEVIASYLGETALRLAQVFAGVRTRRCVLFFDEFDAIAKERGDEHETGEIKRVVTSLLLQVDDLPSHVVVIAASNHAELLDRAVDRRFQLRLSLPPPSAKDRAAWFEVFAAEMGERVGMSPQTFAKRTAGASFSRLQDFADDVRRRQVLDPGVSVGELVSSRLARWGRVTATKRDA